ncbi:Putative odorant-binding protein A10 [Sergentomyia squamirostris]
MKWFALLCSLMVFCSADEQYTNKYDNLDIQEIITNDRILNNYVKCLINEGPCTPDAKELKNILPEALESSCAKCREKQKIGTEIVLNYLIENRPDAWESLEKVYDFAGEYKEKYLGNKTTSSSSE